MSSSPTVSILTSRSDGESSALMVRVDATLCHAGARSPARMPAASARRPPPGGASGRMRTDLHLLGGGERCDLTPEGLTRHPNRLWNGYIEAAAKRTEPWPRRRLGDER